ncbi:hypothetical protein ALP39_200453 [Pseudomonas marginalis pv. marginalis]|nr:hypothetical protein ALP39_200453 [Pseudomonas marginalis pv. marginalis]
MDEIRQFPAVSRVHFMECSGNPSFLPPWGKTAAEVSGLVSCAEWAGVTLKTLLDGASLKPEAKWIIAEGADGAAMTRSIPIEKCLDDVMVVYSQNGERLRPEQDTHCACLFRATKAIFTSNGCDDYTSPTHLPTPGKRRLNTLT